MGDPGIAGASRYRSDIVAALDLLIAGFQLNSLARTCRPGMPRNQYQNDHGAIGLSDALLRNHRACNESAVRRRSSVILSLVLGSGSILSFPFILEFMECPK